MIRLSYKACEWPINTQQAGRTASRGAGPRPVNHLAGHNVDLDRHSVRPGMGLRGFDYRGETMVRFVLFFLDLINARGEQRTLLDHDHVKRSGYSLCQLDCRVERLASAG